MGSSILIHFIFNGSTYSFTRIKPVGGFSVSPALPPGLKLDVITGVISGTPTALWSNTSFVVRGFNDAGTGTAALTININNLPVPVVTSFTPKSAGPGAIVTITGKNFAGASAVSFGGVAAKSFKVNSSTEIAAVLATVATGDVVVTLPNASNSLPGFTFVNPPVISYKTPNTFINGAAISTLNPATSGVASSIAYMAAIKAVNTSFVTPYGTAVDYAGNVYVADMAPIKYINFHRVAARRLPSAQDYLARLQWLLMLPETFM